MIFFNFVIYFIKKLEKYTFLFITFFAGLELSTVGLRYNLTTKWSLRKLARKIYLIIINCILILVSPLNLEQVLPLVECRV